MIVRGIHLQVPELIFIYLDSEKYLPKIPEYYYSVLNRDAPDFYSQYNQNPQEWEQKNGSWAEYENLEKSVVLHELGQILELLYQITKNETSLDTEGDLEYYSTVKCGLQEIREFLQDQL